MPDNGKHKRRSFISDFYVYRALGQRHRTDVESYLFCPNRSTSGWLFSPSGLDMCQIHIRKKHTTPWICRQLHNYFRYDIVDTSSRDHWCVGRGYVCRVSNAYIGYLFNVTTCFSHATRRCRVYNWHKTARPIAIAAIKHTRISGIRIVRAVWVPALTQTPLLIYHRIQRLDGTFSERSSSNRVTTESCSELRQRSKHSGPTRSPPVRRERERERECRSAPYFRS